VRGWRQTKSSAVATAALAAGLLAAIAFPAGAMAPPQAPATRGLTIGFGNGYLGSSDPATRAQWLNRAAEADAGMIKLDVPWYAIAPNRPADPTDPHSPEYDFSGTDAAVRDAAAHGFDLLLLVGGSPNWAQAPGRPPGTNASAWNPDPANLADFMRAVAARYSGNFDPDGAGPEPVIPAVQAVEVWNEPNANGALSPQFDGKDDVAAPIYRNMLNASYDAIKAVDPKMLVVAGGTNPYGAPPGGPYPPGLLLVPPVTFWQDVLCVHPVKTKRRPTSKRGGRAKVKTRYVRSDDCPAPAKFDVLAHHPIDNTGAGPLAHGPLPGDVSTPDLGRITRILRGAEQAGTTLPGTHPLWVTEFWWDSNPPNPLGASLGQQARRIEQSLYLFWKAGANTAINLVIGDSDHLQNLRSGYQSGPYFQDGRPKPALTAFQFPFVTSQINRTTLEAWGKAPEAGDLLIQRRQGGWHTIRTLRVGKGSVFDTRLKLAGKQQLRAKVGGSTSLIRKQETAHRGNRKTPGP
jgi:hypothetical protein